MVARLKWYTGQSKEFIQSTTGDPLVLHTHLFILCKWQGKLIYYPNTLPDAVRSWWQDADILDAFELLMVQFFAARMYNAYLEDAEANVRCALHALNLSHPGGIDDRARAGALDSLLRVETIRADVEIAVHETQNSLVSLSQMIRDIIAHYDRAIGLTDRFNVVRAKLDSLERLNDVVIRTLAQQTNEALLQASLKNQEETAKEGRKLTVLTVALIALTAMLFLRDIPGPVADLIALVGQWLHHLFARVHS